MDDNTALSGSLQRTIISFILPLVAGVAVSLLASMGGLDPTTRAGTAVFLGVVGLVSLVLGLGWYGTSELGLRLGRPLYAGIGFATLSWLGYWLARVIFVPSNRDLIVAPQSGQAFIYLLLFEALSTQLWTFGFLFRGLAGWRGPLTAAVLSGLIFGAVASQLFEEALVDTPASLLYFMLWGILYGLIRLRTGSFLGVVIVQATQALTTWYILLPRENPLPGPYNNLYLATAIAYLLLVWRLWPTEEEDYRV